MPVNYFDIHIGNTCIHHTHRLYKISGLIYCNKCGAYAIKRVQKLASECVAPTAAGECLINLVNKGKIPSGNYLETRFSNVEVSVFGRIEETIRGMASIAQGEFDSPSVDDNGSVSSYNMGIDGVSNSSGSD